MDKIDFGHMFIGYCQLQSLHDVLRTCLQSHANSSIVFVSDVLTHKQLLQFLSKLEQLMYLVKVDTNTYEHKPNFLPLLLTLQAEILNS